MPKGKENIARKGENIKPNTNAEDSIDTAAEVAVDPDDIITHGDARHRAAQAPANEAATQREDEQQES